MLITRFIYLGNKSEQMLKSGFRNLRTEGCFGGSLATYRFKIHSFSILSDDRFKASSKTIPPYSAI